MQRSVLYNLGFATAVCIICAVVVSSAVVALHDRQEMNAALDKQKNVLVAAGLATDEEHLSRDEITRRFAPIEPVLIELATGEEVEDADPGSFDQKKAANTAATSEPAPPNAALVQRIPHRALIYRLVGEDGAVELYVLPIEGKGLWSTLYGFLALDADLTTIRGITFYEHKETPGLGGEVDNPHWKALWPGREAFDESGEPAISVVKGRAGSPEQDPHHVDGLSGATMTSRGVTNLLQFWLGENGFGPFLARLRADGKEA
jgi:Na+-transporting NADH:ubiquinone oxidoreductase subunit C